MLFGLASAINPPWLEKISNPGRKVEAKSVKDYGDIYLRKGDYRRAVSQYLHALSIKPDYIDATVNLAITYGQIGLVDSAIIVLKGIPEEDNEQPEVIYYNLAQIYEKKGDKIEAINYYTLAAQTAPSPIYSFREIGKLYTELGAWGLALEAFQKAIDHRLDLKNSYLDMLRRDEDLIEKSEILDEDIKSFFENGTLSENLSVYDEKVFQDVLAKDKNLARIYSQMGYVYAVNEEYSLAIPYFRLALNIWPDNKEMQNNLNAALERDRAR